MGYGRSGSTLLDVLLDAQPGVLGMGEVTHLFRFAAEGGACACGSSYVDCRVWGQAIRAVMPPSSRNLWAAAKLNRAVEAQAGVAPRHRRRWEALWRTVFQTAADVSRASVVVDSSKSTRDTRRRAEALAGAGLQVTTVLPVRPLGQVVRSGVAAAGRRRQGEARTWEEVVSAARTVLGWTTTMRWSVPRADLAVPFATIAGDPRGLIGRLLACEADAVDLVGHAGHGVAGNRMRRVGMPISPGGVSAHPVSGWLSPVVLDLLDRVMPRVVEQSSLSDPRVASGP